MDTAKLQEIFTGGVEKTRAFLSDMTANMPEGTAHFDLTTALVVLLVIVALWYAFKLGVQQGARERVHDKKADVLERIGRLFYEVRVTFNNLEQTPPSAVSEKRFQDQALRLRKVAALLKKDLLYWGLFLPDDFLTQVQTMIKEIEKAAQRLEEEKVTEKTKPEKVLAKFPKQWDSLAKTYESFARFCRKEFGHAKRKLDVRKLF